ncbi:MAG: CBS domain-containing protein [Proteobacteria bacterium]|nr:CBS domain-containing protein [Pseudomonadota bacterium]
MPVADICRKNLVTIEAHATLLDAMRLMMKNHIGDLVVIGSREGAVQVLGIITDRDIALSASDNRPIGSKRVESVMTYDVHTLKGSEGIAQATAFMREKCVRRMPVVDDSGQVLGILSIDDLYQLLSQELSDLAAISDRQICREGIPRAITIIPPEQESKSSSAHH